MNLWGILGVAEFEARRGLTAGRWATWAILAGFPIFLILFVVKFIDIALPDQVIGTFCYFLVCQVACPMVLLLLATPVINGELEGKTWSYLSTRPGGRCSLVLGKLLLAVVVAMAVGAIAITGVCTCVESRSMKLWLAELAVMCLACFSYGGLFVLIGTWVQKRAMAAALVYMLLVEGVVSMIPATINQFTVSYRLRSLLYWWMEWKPPERMEHFVNLDSCGWHLAALLGYLTMAVGFSLARAQWGEYSNHVEAA